MSRRPAAALVALLATGAVLLGGCGSSPEDTARDDGNDLGGAVRQLFDASSADEARAAAAEVRKARGDIASDTRERVADEVGVQSGALQDAAAAYQRAVNATDPDQAADARQDLRAAVQQIRSQSSSLADDDNSISVAFWQGFRDGYDDD